MIKNLFFFGIMASLFQAAASASEVVYSYKGKDYEGYVLNKGKDAPTVFLLHDWDGLTEYEIMRSKMLRKLGYSVFALDLFGKGIRPKEVKDRRQHTGELYKDREKMRGLMNAALAAAKKKGLNVEKRVAMGYCFGGAAVLEWARSGVEFDAFVTFHGGLATPKGQDYSKSKGQFLIFHGAADTAITMDDFASLAKQFEEATAAHEMIVYGTAPHAFTVTGSGRYHQIADVKSWQRFKDFLGEVF